MGLQIKYWKKSNKLFLVKIYKIQYGPYYIGDVVSLFYTDANNYTRLFYFRSKDHFRSSVAILRRALFSASFKPVWLHVKFFPQLFLNACMTRVKTNLGDEQASQWLFTLIDHYLIKFVNDLDTFFSPRLWLCTGIESELFFPPFSGSMIRYHWYLTIMTCFSK